MRPVTILDVAREAGVSKTTASEALRGLGRMTDETRSAVQDAAQHLGFRANRSARSLRGSTTGAVGLYLPQARVRSSYYLDFLYGVVEGTAAGEVDLVMTVARQDAPQRYIGTVDGVILCDPRADDPTIVEILETGLPVVSCEPVPEGSQPAGVVWSDGARWTTALLDELASAGVRNPALLATTTQGSWVRTVRNTYAQWCAAHGIATREGAAPFGATPARLQRVAVQLIEAHPEVDALVCLGDSVATTVLPALTAAGREVGGDLLLASCSEQQIPPNVYAAINTRGEAAGRACAELLLHLLAGTAAAGVTREIELEILVNRPRTA